MHLPLFIIIIASPGIYCSVIMVAVLDGHYFQVHLASCDILDKLLCNILATVQDGRKACSLQDVYLYIGVATALSPLHYGDH